MIKALDIRDKLKVLLPTVAEIAAMGITVVSVGKMDAVDTYPAASIYIESIDSDLGSRDCRTREPIFRVDIWAEDTVDAEKVLLEAGAAAEKAIEAARLTDFADTNLHFVGGQPLRNELAENTQGGWSFAFQASYGVNITI